MKKLIFLILATLSAVAFAHDMTPPAGWIDGFVLLNGLRIHYWRTGGEKPPMVLAHGSGDDGRCWWNFAKEFAADYDIVMIDARGHGHSDPPSTNDLADAQAEDLAALIRELKLVKPIVMGHSMGSSATAWMAAKYPDVPKAVVLEDPSLGPARDFRANAKTRRAQILALNNKTEAELVEECVTKNPKWDREECENWAPSKRLHHPNTALGGAAMRPAFSELLPKITAPTLILKADADAATQAENEKVAALLPRGKIIHIKGAGHNVRRDNKADTVAALREFLRSL